MLKPGESYSSRRADKVVRNFTWGIEADEVMRLYCPGGRRELGKFFERLVFEHHAREGEKQRISEALSVIMSQN